MALADNIVAYWNLDETSGNPVDATGNGHTLSNNNTVTFTTGKINNGADFERGSTQYFSKGDNAAFEFGDFTFAAWVNPESLPTAGNLMAFMGKWGAGSNQRSYGLLYENNAGTHRFNLPISNNGSSAENLRVNHTLSTGSFQLVLVTLDISASQFELFVNNTSIGTASGTITSLFNGTADFELGAFNSGDTFDGLMDEVGIWSRILTSDERTALYNAGAGVTYPFAGGKPTRTLLGAGL